MQQINNLSAKIAKFRDQIDASIQRVVSSGWVVLGPEVKRFEASFAQYLGAEHCITVANGTDAIELALKALGVKKGDLVATIANAGMYTTTSVLAIGATPAFMDIDPVTQVVTLAEVKRVVEAGAKVVVVTHLYGLAIPEIQEIAHFCADNGIPLLEDCAQAHGARMHGKRVGTFGDAASFSFYPTKNLGALGDGGAVVTNSAAIAQQVAQLRQYGWSSKYCVELDGARNSRLDEMQAAILSEFLPHLDEGNARRHQIAERYRNEINQPDIEHPQGNSDAWVAHLYVLKSVKRDSLQQHLRAQQIASEVHYPIPDYKQPVFGNTYADIHLANTEHLAKEILTLPCYPEMSEDQVSAVIQAVNGWAA
ncbi:DegT/DnrJ/EryC1/StrS family aminotransferase [Pseudomonas vancouverensis]|uniref:DegT/DnrJ/EryC1/StrS family aminotransferase n=1 Tax=Pseudomonas vancouverensis TaxID=95300 RepID=A0A1H2MH15_PSEVA|nr:DegT/DnrJ/EryC1/StrS family aminotransferase [Pseudomonas vancouverensis]KAB0490645.1 DegT/DnrJ/EryC1/StrS family aminotransferase [Pseudomonas vancouverensis]TDB62908.1 DegT/DnrJ/EryC1/StrS family aminotransferase [Pseudomonas vancouverensis]SDU92374.1 dTDP-4-amino-4,6-dideoxygalactose transaminase [Pseudomonas vancouverensis]